MRQYTTQQKREAKKALATLPVVDNHADRRDMTSGGKTAHYGLTQPLAGAVWSGDIPVPAIGDRVIVNFNGFGPGVVRGYFTEPGSDCDYLGVYVECDASPIWWILQTARDGGGRLLRCTMAFGAEVRAEPVRCVVSATVSRRNEYGEYVVRARDQYGKRWPEADYYTDDLTDARATAAAMIAPAAEAPAAEPAPAPAPAPVAPNCRLCGAQLTAEEVRRYAERNPDLLAEGDVWCAKCDAADAAAEAASLHAAESGLGMEQLRDCQYSMAYDN